jgi:hypothetical protein
MSARDEAVEMIRRICPPHLSRDEYGRILAEKFDAHRAQVLAEVEARLAAMTDEADQYTAQLETEGGDSSPMYAQHIGLRRARDAVRRMTGGEKATADAATATPDFFEPGHSYTHRNGSDFRCVTVTAHPQTGERLAMGWHVDSWGLHYPTTVGINQWRHEYDGVEAPIDTEAGDGRG